MATKKVCECMLCLSQPATTSRRKLYSPSTEHVLPSVRELLPESFHFKLQDVDGAYLCTTCFRKMERIQKARADIAKKETELKAQVEAVYGPHMKESTVPDLAPSSEVRQVRESPETPRRNRARRWYDTPTRRTLDRMIPSATSPAVSILVSGQTKHRAQVITRSSGFKKLVRGVSRKSHGTVARQALSNSKTRKQVLKALRRYIQRDMKRVCSKKENSVLRRRGVEDVKSFSWDVLQEELESKAPTLYGVLRACVDVKRRTRKSKTKATSNTAAAGMDVTRKTRKTQKRTMTTANKVALGVCAGVLLRHRNQRMNLIQRITSLILHNGHSSKQVYTRLQRMHMSMSRDGIIGYLDLIGKDYDEPVTEWRKKIEDEMRVSQYTLDKDVPSLVSATDGTQHQAKEPECDNSSQLSSSSKSESTNGASSSDSSSPSETSPSRTSASETSSFTVSTLDLLVYNRCTLYLCNIT